MSQPVVKTERHVHVVGAGLAGLSAALQLTLMGEKVSVYEASPSAGGRCRSYFDRALECRIDNGSHMVMSGNVATMDYLALTNALDTMHKADVPLFPFMDLETGERWNLRLTGGRFPRWILKSSTRIPGTKIRDYLSFVKMLFAGDEDTVLATLNPDSVLYRRFWEPLAVAALNTEPENASAALLSNLLGQSFLEGSKACQPMLPKIGMSESFVDPCLDVLQKHGTEIVYGKRLRSLSAERQSVTRLDFGDEVIEVAPQDWVILAVPPWIAAELLPGLTTPTAFRSILNAHYKIEVPPNAAGFTGLVGGVAEWVFVKPGIVSVTISASDRYEEYSNEIWGIRIWQDLARLFDLDPVKVPPFRIVREKRATFAATPEQNRMRPRAYLDWENLALAGDWTDTNLPSTIESALRSGIKAAQLVLRWG